MDQLRVGIVGYGSAGRGIHGRLLAAAEGMRVTTVVTRDPGRAAAAATEHGAVAVPTVEELAARATELDLAVVASPTADHADHATMLLAAGIPVVVDKPLALTGPQAAAVLRLAQDRGVPLTVFQNRRWDGEHRTLRRLLAEGALGEVVRYEARFERWRPQPKDRWRERLTAAEGGGLLLDLQSHLVDGALDLLGPVTRVYAESAAVTTRGDDVTFLALTHTSGARSHLGATSLAGAPGPRTRLLGTVAAYVVGTIEDEPSDTDPWRDAPGCRGWLVRGEERVGVPREPGTWEDFYPAVRRALRGERKLPVDPADAVAGLDVLDAARRSAASGVVVPVGS